MRRSNCRRIGCWCWIGSIPMFNSIEWYARMWMLDYYTKIGSHCRPLFRTIVSFYNFFPIPHWRRFEKFWKLKKSFFSNKCRSQNVTVRVGSNNWKTGGFLYEVNKIIPHENFNITNYSNDICFVEIDGQIEFNQNVQPIKVSKKFIKPSTGLQTTGWGRLRVSFYCLSIN